MKKNKNFSELMSYAGKHRRLTYLSLVLSIISAVFALLPFVFIFFIIKEIINVAPNYSEAVSVVAKRKAGRFVCADFHSNLCRSAYVFP